VISKERLRLSFCLLLALAQGITWSQSGSDALKSGFEQPPASARPRVWWHWMNGNISKEGIKLDLDWMHRVGIAGFQNFDAALATPQVVDKRLAYMTPEWKDAFKYATTLADQYGMEMAIAGSPGWSESGGPWVPPSHAMKKYVWSETAIEGGRTFHGEIAHPPTRTGAFQNVPVRERPDQQASSAPPQFYADAAVVAFRGPWKDDLQSLQPKMTSSGGSPNFAALSDGDIVTTTELPIPSDDQRAWIQWEFPNVVTVRSLTIATSPGGATNWRSGIGIPEKTLEASDDGVNFREVTKIVEGRTPQTTVSIPETAAKFFRVTFKPMPPPPPPAWAQGADMGGPPRAAATTFKIAELALHEIPRVNHFEEKAAFATPADLYQYATLPIAPDQAIAEQDVVDLTSKMHSDGTLDWTPPAGDWVVLRFGYSLLGITNHPATKEATGLEVDKLDHRYVKDYFEKYLDSYRETVGPELIGKRGIEYVINDSWEAGSENWTDNMIAQFTRLRGYSPVPWMPVLAGYIVKSSEASDRFLWDFRKTIADLIAEEHYGQLEATLHEWHMGHYGESHEVGRALPADGMEVKKMNEVPMSAMWTQVPGVFHEQYGYNADDRESASVAHIYGQNLAAAESMTAAAAPWAWSPATLKPTADQEFLNGINRIVVHESAHQPLVGPRTAPGLTLGPFGQWFNRNETWADEAGAWTDYLARTSYMLQQGKFCADVLYFYGEDSNLTAIFASKSPDVPAGYGFDYVNADALIHQFKVSGGRITTTTGMTYRLLGLDAYSSHMSLPVLKAIRELVEEGATVAGAKPADDPSLSDDHAEFKKIATELFGDGMGKRTVGRGTVYAGQTVADALADMRVAPDFTFTKPEPETRLEFVHRRLSGADLYFVDNRSEKSVATDASFRISGKEPELWYAETGKSKPASYRIADGSTTVPLNLEPWGTVFVVFRRPTRETTRTLPTETETQLLAVDGPWSLAFQPDRGAPASVTLDRLISWPESDDKGIRYFSGTATYTKTIDANAQWFSKGRRIWLDLGDVKNLAEVVANGRSLGIVWHSPYKVDITDAIKPGANQLEIKVTNAWVNRLIGDQQPDATTKYTFADVKPYKANSPLQPSGLIGPVTIRAIGN